MSRRWTLSKRLYVPQGTWTSFIQNLEYTSRTWLDFFCFFSTPHIQVVLFPRLRLETSGVTLTPDLVDFNLESPAHWNLKLLPVLAAWTTASLTSTSPCLYPLVVDPEERNSAFSRTIFLYMCKCAWWKYLPFLCWFFFVSLALLIYQWCCSPVCAWRPRENTGHFLMDTI